MSSLLPYLINTLLGAGGGYLGNMLKKNGLGMVGNLIAGAVGGNGLPALLGAVAPTLMDGGGDAASFSPMGLITSLVGGSAASLIGGLIKKA